VAAASPATNTSRTLRIACDEGMARVLRILPTPQLRRWQLSLLRNLIVIGAIAVVYFLARFGEWVCEVWSSR
jgi:hypothetical protein